MPNIIIKNYEHYNRSLPNWDTPKGKYIRDKAHYESEMKKAGMISFDDACKIKQKSTRKEYELSKEGREIINAAKRTKDSKGNVKLSDKTIDAMIKIGAIGKNPPKECSDNGGFYTV